ncbi:hypothetical protein TNCV_4759161 [Trichonephila clavipes]|nr:hypothetical protein TNCV_4759161 [Trichonephila clavipes]
MSSILVWLNRLALQRGPVHAKSVEAQASSRWCGVIARKSCGSPVVKVSDHGRHVMSSSPLPLKTRRVRQICLLNLSRAQASSRWYGVVIRRGGASSSVIHVT